MYTVMYGWNKKWGISYSIICCSQKNIDNNKISDKNDSSQAIIGSGRKKRA